jgi:hypothetical protein
MAETQKDAEIVAKLAKPGAGLPLHHALMMRYLVGPFVAKTSDWDKDSKGFASVHGKILKLAEKMTDAELSTRVLVPGQYGLEDSSRYWSAAMVLEHMVIVGSGIKSIVISLSNGVVPDFTVEIGKVKPKGAGTPQDAVRNFREFAATAIPDIDRDAKDRKSKAALTHPWFGPFTAHQWHWLLTAHGVIHLTQLRAIAERLKPAE